MVLPMYHIYGFYIAILTGLYAGSKIITLPKFTPENYIQILERSEVTHIFAAPPLGKKNNSINIFFGFHLIIILALFLMNHEGLKKEYFQKLSFIVNGAAPLRYTDETKLMEKVSNGNTRFKQGEYSS